MGNWCYWYQDDQDDDTSPQSPSEPVHSEDSTEQAQEQGHHPEVDAAEKGPVGDTVTGSEPHPQGDALVPSTILLSLCPCPEATTVHTEISPRRVHGQGSPTQQTTPVTLRLTIALETGCGHGEGLAIGVTGRRPQGAGRTWARKKVLHKPSPLGVTLSVDQKSVLGLFI